MLPVPSLLDDDVDRMLAACLGGARVPAQLAEFVRAHSDGNPFLVEELLAGVVAAGELRLVDGALVQRRGADPDRAGQPRGRPSAGG